MDEKRAAVWGSAKVRGLGRDCESAGYTESYQTGRNERDVGGNNKDSGWVGVTTMCKAADLATAKKKQPES